MTREKRVLAAAGLFAAAAAVRLFRLDHFSYGLDEILQAYWISGDWKFFWKSIRFDAVHPPLDFVLLVAAGAVLAWTRAGLRFLVAWGVGGLVVIDLLGRLHPHYDVSRRYLPAGLAFPALAAIPLAALAAKPRFRPVAAALLVLVLLFDFRSLAVYFREGRADWRTLTDYLRRESPPNERVFTENQYSQLCVAYYLVGPRWMFHGGKQGREVLNLDGEVVRLTWSWRPGERAWLVVGGPGAPSPDLRR
jgi:hypothetical protein